MSQSRPSARASSGARWGWSLLAMGILVPWLAAGTILALASSPRAEVATQPKAILAEPRETTSDEAVPIALSVTWVDGVSALSPPWAGTVTAVSPDVVGKVVTSGTRVVQIDGVWRIAYHTPAPFYRPLSSGVVGDDVKMLNAMLDALGYSAGGNNTYSKWTDAGVKSLTADLGAEYSGSFDPAWVIWLPGEELAVSTVSATVGSLAPEPSTPVLTTARQPGVVSIASDTEEALDRPSGNEWVLKVDENVIPYTGDPTNAVADPRASLAGLPVSDSPIGGALLRAEPVTGLQVPTSALVTDDDGQSCLLTADRANSAAKDWDVSPVEIVGGELGVVILRPTEEIGRYVVQNPAALKFQRVDC